MSRSLRLKSSIVVLMTATVGLLGPAGASVAAARPADGGRLVFVRGNQIFTASQTGRAVRQLTTSAKNYRPHWSPDGRRIAFVHEPSDGVRDIWVMAANGSHKRQVTHLGDTTEPTWSPDGRELAFGANGDGPYAATGRSLRVVGSRAPFGPSTVLPGNDETGDPLVVSTLSWSPDGSRIAFYSDTFPNSPDHYLLVYTIATHAIDALSGIGGSCCGEGWLGDPTWTTDGSAVAYTERRWDGDQPEPAGSSVRLTDLASDTNLEHATVVGDSDPDYSPSGDRMVFSHYSWVYRSAADGSGRVKVLKGYQPDWQPRR